MRQFADTQQILMELAAHAVSVAGPRTTYACVNMIEKENDYGPGH